MNTPSITPAQIAAFIQPPITLAIAFGLPIDKAQETAMIGMAGTISTALIVADMFIRRARANNAAAIVQSQYVAAQIQEIELPPPAAFIQGAE